MKIGFVCSEYPPGPHGGIGTLVQLLARNLVQEGHEVRVAGAYPRGYPAPDYEVDRGVRVWRLREPAGRLGWLRARLKLFRLIREWTRHRALDLVEVPDYGGPAARWPRLSIPVITRLSGSASYFAAEIGQRPRRVNFWLERSSLRRSDFWCSESRYLATQTRQLFALRSGPDAVIYNPVEIPRDHSNVQRIRNRVMFAGTLTKKKGIISLVRSWPKIKAACPDSELHIWGKDGPAENGQSMRAFLPSLVEPDVVPSIYFHGHVPLEDLLAEFHVAGLAVLPSYAEGFALTPLHAMAAECPVIYTRRGSGPELIEDGTDGLLVDPDSIDDISAAVIRLLRNEALAQQLGRAGRQKVKDRFSWKTLFGQNVGFYEECVREFEGRSKSSR